ncbi:MAG TPA: GHKL domain-containing protein [Erysipelotrichaceae bacterium]|nr:GHKL domain-containing protein [Erysipelotrichaceae bacterium]
MKIYFQYILDLTTYISIFFVSAALCVYCWPKKINKKEIIRLILIFIISYSVIIVGQSLMFGFLFLIREPRVLGQMLYSLTMPLLILFFSLIFSKGHSSHKLIKNLILVSSIMVTEVLSKNAGFIAGQLTNDTFIVVVLARSLPYSLFFFICLLLNRVDVAHHRHLSKEMIVIITSLASLLIVVSVIEHAYDNHELMVNVLLSVLDFVLLLILAFSYYATYTITENRNRITNLEVQATLGEAERMSIAIDQKNREELEKIRHDLKNQLAYVGVLLEQGKSQEAERYIKDYSNKQEVLRSFSCSNSVINSIINLELTKAKIKGIDIDVKVVVPPRLPFADSDLVSLITNMVDNALDNYYSEKEDKIIIRIAKQNDYIRFFISNPFSMEGMNKSNITKTRKIGRGHGYGTKIIRNIVSTYDGYVDFNIEDNRFVCDALLSLNKKVEQNV